MFIPFSARVRIPDHVLKRELDGEAVILNLNNERYYGLNEMGTKFLMALEKAPSIQIAYETLLTEYDVPENTLLSDLQALLEKLCESGIIVIDP